MKLYTENLVKKYRNRTVVDHVSVEVEQGEIVGLAWTERCRKNNIILHDCRIDTDQEKEKYSLMMRR